METSVSVFKLVIFVAVMVELKFDVYADFENSWTMYMEQPCCSGTGNHHVRHHRGAFWFRGFYGFPTNAAFIQKRNYTNLSLSLLDDFFKDTLTTI